MTTTFRQSDSVHLLPGEDPNVVYPEEEKVPESELQGNAPPLCAKRTLNTLSEPA